MPPDALIYRVDATVAGIAHAQTPPADTTEKHALQQAKSLSGRARQPLTIGAVAGETTAIGLELIPVDVAFVMIAYRHPPGVLRDRTRAGGDLAGWTDLLGRLVAAEYIDAGIRRIGQDAEDARMRQPTPNKLAIPCPAVCSARETQAKLLEALHNAVGGALACEQFEDRSNCALHLPVGIEHDLVFVEDEPDRQRKPQIASYPEFIDQRNTV